MLKNKQEKSTFSAKNYLYFAIATAILVFVIKVPLSEKFLSTETVTLTEMGRIAIGVLLACLFLWITEPIPFHITGFIGVLMLSALKTDTFVNVVKTGFGNDTIIFFIGVLTISSFITRSGLGKRMSVFILSKTGNKTSNVLLGFLIAGTVLSMWVTDMAVAAILVPLAKAILDEEGIKPLKSTFGKALMIACTWGPLIGGIGTPAGCGPNPLAIGFVRDMLDIEITFLDWMVYGVPCAILLIFPAWGLLLLFFKPEIKYLSKTKEKLVEEFKNMPPMNRVEKSTSVIFLVTVVLWLTSSWLGTTLGIKITTSMPAIAACCLLFFPGVSDIKWKEVQNEISWDSIILIATGISLGMIVYQTGAAEWLAMKLLSNLADFGVIIQIFLVVFIISILKVVLTSNTVTATVIIPIMIALCQKCNLPVMRIIIPASLTLSLAFILVTSTPTSVIPYSTGYFKISDMAKVGLVMTIVTSITIAIAIFGIGLLTGIY